MIAKRPAAMMITIFDQLACQKKMASTTMAAANTKRQKQSFMDPFLPNKLFPNIFITSLNQIQM
jgi:hypothetical protein